MTSCWHCGAEHEDGSRFCDACGSVLFVVCAGCTSHNRPTARFCRQCGTRLAAIAPPEPAPPAAVPAPPPEPLLPSAEEGVRKQVTILFADISKSTQMLAALGTEQAMDLLDLTMQAMKAAVVEAGGIVNRVEGDGIMAMFGVPLAREDHAIRACLAARAMLAAVARVDAARAIRVGLASGDVVIRPTGRDSSDWDAVGITPVIARRLEQRAGPGEVLIADSTARLVRGFADTAPAGGVEVQGIAEPVEAFALLDATARPSWEVRAAAHALNHFVGREAELAQLAAAATRAALGRGRVVTLVGDAGLGKSRLIHEFLRALPTGAWHVLRVAAVSHGVGAAYHLAAELLRAWLDVEVSDDRAEVGRKLDQASALHGAGLDLVPLRSLLDLPVEDAGWTALDLPARRARVIAAMRLAILREAALHPLVLVVEDLHWADPPSVELLDTIVDGLGASRLLVVATSRPAPPGETRQPRWSTRSYSAEIQLHPLEPEQADALLGELLGGDEALASLRQHIVGQAEGTPLFLEEIARSLTERGVVVSEPSRARLTRQITELEIPASVQAVLAERVDRLPPARRRLLQLASVIGKDLPLALLRRVTDLPEDALRQELAALQAAEFLYEINLPSGTEYTFKHALTHAVAYEGMLRRHRRDLHARVLAAIQALYADRLDEMIERLAEHAFKGEAWEAAFAYALRGGQRASGRWAWREAVALLEQAAETLSYLPQTPETISRAIGVRLDLRVALAAVGDFPRIGQCLQEARDLASIGGDPLQLAQIDTSRCISFSLLGGLDEAVQAGRHALDTAARANDPSTFLNAVFALGQAHWYRGDLVRAEAVLVDGLPYVRGSLRLQRSGTTGTASVLHLVCLSKTHALAGRFDRAAALADEAIGIAEDTQRPYDLAYARVAEGFQHFMREDHDAAVVALERGLAHSRSGSVALLVASIARYLGRSYVHVGRPDAAHELLDEAIGYSRTHGLVGFRAWCEAARAQALVPAGGSSVDGDRSEAIAAFASVRDLAHAHGYRPVEVHAAHMLGVLLADGPQADRARAEDWLRQAVSLAERLELAPQLAAARRDLARLF